MFKQKIFKGRNTGDQVMQFMRALEAEEVSFEVVIRSPSKPRSLNENSYYWGVIIQIISDETGHDPNEIHHFMRTMFLRIDNGTEKIPRIRSTTTLTTREAEEYYQKIRDWAAYELDILIPLPHE